MRVKVQNKCLRLFCTFFFGSDIMNADIRNNNDSTNRFIGGRFMDHFKLVSEFKPTGDQPQAIEVLVKGF